MYNYRKLSKEQQERVLADRKKRRRPWHSPPHQELEGETFYIITAACYEHRHIIGYSPERMSECETELLEVFQSVSTQVYAWCVLPNHYHVLVCTAQLKELLRQLGKFHGRSSFRWNGEEQKRGRHCWCNAYDRIIRSVGHLYASLNYIHHNAVHHGYISKWQDWPWSSVHEFLAQYGREETLRLWRTYPLLDYGKKWDIY
ncbi:MAG: transposase [Acidobacteria bacterium]|nr:transposase [Acidobacteriota bacterium]